MFVLCKHKTAYEMRISDWSSDVCSSDLYRLEADAPHRYVNYSGCGNTLDASEPAVARLIADSLRHWADAGNVDGSSEERRGGQECVSTCRSRWSPFP